MEQGDQMVEDAQLWALEHGRSPRSRAASIAGAALAEYHKDLPEIVGSSSELLSRLGMDAATSRTTSRRLVDSATRELAGGGQESYGQYDRTEIMRRTLRDVLIQEAAGHEITLRGGIDPARALDNDPDRGQGAKAAETLRRQGVDVDGLFGHMTEHDLATTSHGAYNKVSLLAHPHLTKALEVDGAIMNSEQVAANRHINAGVDAARPGVGESPVRHHGAIAHPLRRLQPPVHARQPSFGRRVAAHNAAMAAGM